MPLNRRRSRSGWTRATSRRRLLPIAAAIAGLVFAAVAVASAIGSTKQDRPRGARVTTRIVWRGCGARLQCARVRVPLDWAHPQGPTISLAVIRYQVRRPGRQIGSLLVNFGGPGVSGVTTLRATPVAQLDALSQRRFDVVVTSSLPLVRSVDSF